VLTVGSLFSGIGGLDLGLERAGMSVRWQCEIDPYCRAVLAHHWPGVPCYSDIRAVDGDAERVDLICGGFPCQDISSLGRKAGIEGAKSGLWAEFARVVGELRPSYVLVENVTVLRSRGLDRVLGDLSELGYDAEWDCLSAREFGAPIRGRGRDRIFIVAYPNSGGCSRTRLPREAERQVVGSAAGRHSAVAGIPSATSHHWTSEPDVGRVADGIPSRVERLRALGNAVVPQVAEAVGRMILDADGA
jgi:DNA (cytosine-5)-methyltransferase 1